MIKPIGDNVLLEKKEEKQETLINGIYLKENEKNNNCIGKIIEISDEIKNNNTVKINDEILYREYSGTEIEYKNKKLVLIKLKDILGIIQN